MDKCLANITTSRLASKHCKCIQGIRYTRNTITFLESFILSLSLQQTSGVDSSIEEGQSSVILKSEMGCSNRKDIIPPELLKFSLRSFPAPNLVDEDCQLIWEAFVENKSGSRHRQRELATQGEEERNFYLCDKAFIDGLKTIPQLLWIQQKTLELFLQLSFTLKLFTWKWSHGDEKISLLKSNVRREPVSAFDKNRHLLLFILSIYLSIKLHWVGGSLP